MKLTRRNVTSYRRDDGAKIVIADVFADGVSTGLTVTSVIVKTDRTKTVMVKQSRNGIIRRVPETHPVWDITMDVFDRLSGRRLGTITSDNAVDYPADANKVIKAKGWV